MRKKLSAGEIVSTLFYKDHETKKIPLKENYLSGNDIHNILGCNNKLTFRRYYYYDNELWLLTGRPDSIRDENILELKTYRSEKTKKIQEQAGVAQLDVYSYLTGLNDQIFYLYDVTDEMLYKEKRKFNKKRFKSIVDKAIELSTLK